MKGDSLPDSDHVSRYCGFETAPNGEITGAAFLLRSGEPYLSVNWLEHLKAKDRTDELRELRDRLAKRLRLGAKARLAVLQVKRSREYVSENSPDNRVLLFTHEPITPPNSEDDSHSGIYNTKSEDEMLIAELLAESVEDNYAAKP